MTESCQRQTVLLLDHEDFSLSDVPKSIYVDDNNDDKNEAAATSVRGPIDCVAENRYGTTRKEGG